MVAAAGALLGASIGAVPAAATGEIGPSYSMTANGRLLAPAGAMTTLGVFPTGGALTPDGKFYWAANSGGGTNDVSIVDTATGAVVQTLPLPGAYGGVAFTPSGTTAYVSGEAKGSPPTGGPTTGDAGDVIHVFSVNTVSGLATELAPIAIPRTGPGSGQVNSLPPVTAAWPDGLAVSPDGTKLVVALNQADNAAIVDLATAPPTVKTVRVGAYPAQVAFDPAGRAYVSNEEDGTISVIDPAAGTVMHTISGLGGPRGDKESHPAGMLADPARPRLYVAVANRDTVAVINTTTRTVTDRISVARPQGLGAAPVSLGIAPDGTTLYSADAGEDAVAAIALTNRPGGPRRHHVIGKIPTAAYPTDVKITPDGLTLVWLAGKGLGAGPNPGYLFSGGSPYGSYVLEMLNGRLGRLVTPTDAQIQTTYTPQADAQVRPANAASPPAGTPVVGPHGGPSRKIKHVFYIVRENRTYDQIFGTDPRGDGEPALELFDDNGVAGPTGGVTPNAHALSRTFPLLDHVYANSEVSVDGHLITAGSYATDYVQRATAANYSGRGRAFDFGVFPVTFGPNYFIFDEAVRRNVSFRNYGEQASGISPTGNDGRPTYAPVVANTDVQYPGNLQIGCSVSGGGGQVMAPATCTQDSGLLGPHGEVTAPVSRFNDFRANFAAQVLTGRVSRLNYLILPNDHTNGTTPNGYTPKALMADNDLALGQVVDLVSHSPIWKDTAIFVVEDDSQDGADHVDAHRMPAFVIGPCAKRGGVVVDTRYDQYSVLRTIGLILGLKPLSLNDGLATPMYDAFDNTSCDPAGTRYSAIEPEQSLHEINSPIVPPPDAALSAAIFRGMDRVPQAISDRILWHSVHGAHSTPPAPGPNASLAEHARADSLLRVLARHGDVKAWLAKQGGDDD